MSTFICTECGCIDNTACGSNYHSVVGRMNFYKDLRGNTKILCAECTPTEYTDGSINEETGKWHNKFPKQHWSEVGTVEEIIAEYAKNQGDYVNALEYFRENGLIQERCDRLPEMKDKKVVVIGHDKARKALAGLATVNALLGGSYDNFDMPRFKYERNVPEYARKKEQGRNERCACGSGKKYKYCCGK